MKDDPGADAADKRLFAFRFSHHPSTPIKPSPVGKSGSYQELLTSKILRA
jgi:hypothetical protein